MANVEILAESEAHGAWIFETQVIDELGELHRHTLTLDWPDYNLWSADGSDEPARVAEAVLWFLYQRRTRDESSKNKYPDPNADASSSEDPMRPALNAAIARRLFHDADQVIPTLIRRD